MTIDTEKLRALLAAGTPGPWRAVIEGDQPVVYYRGLIGLCANKNSDGYVSVVTEANARPVHDVKANAALIAAAVNALPELLNETERLRADLARVTAERNHMRAIMADEVRRAAVESTTAELARMTAERDAMRTIVRAAVALQASGYDGPFIGEVREPLFGALAALDPKMLEGLDDG